MTAHLEAQVPEPAARPAVPFKALDPVDAMLRGRYAQEPLWHWLRERIRSVYPK